MYSSIEAIVLKEVRGLFNTLTLHYNLFRIDGQPSSSLLARGLEERMSRGLDRVYRLLGLLYPWKDIAAARWPKSAVANTLQPIGPKP